MNKMNSFFALATLFRLFFLSNLSNTDKVSLVASLGKTSLAKLTAMFNNAFLLKLRN